MKILKKIIEFIFLLPIYIYRYSISPLKPPTCRYLPTCSEISIQAIKKHGVIKGVYLGTKRILNCHPWGGSGFDPVPEEFNFRKRSEL
ncbi:MAG: membrane protein insertion efficiency factor YidD [Paludibacteraceae bacterium]